MNSTYTNEQDQSDWLDEQESIAQDFRIHEAEDAGDFHWEADDDLHDAGDEPF